MLLILFSINGYAGEMVESQDNNQDVILQKGDSKDHKDAAGVSAAEGYCDATTKDECRVEVINAGTVYGKGKGFIISN